MWVVGAFWHFTVPRKNLVIIWSYSHHSEFLTTSSFWRWMSCSSEPIEQAVVKLNKYLLFLKIPWPRRGWFRMSLNLGMIYRHFLEAPCWAFDGIRREWYKDIYKAASPGQFSSIVGFQHWALTTNTIKRGMFETFDGTGSSSFVWAYTRIESKDWGEDDEIPGWAPDWSDLDFFFFFFFLGISWRSLEGGASTKSRGEMRLLRIGREKG